MRGTLKIKGKETNIFDLTLFDIIKQLRNIDEVNFTPASETGRQYFDVVVQKYEGAQFDEDALLLYSRFKEIITQLFNDESKKAKLEELGVTELDFALIRNDEEKIKEISMANQENNLYALTQKYRMCGLHKSIYGEKSSTSQMILKIANTTTTIDSIKSNIFVSANEEPKNLLIKIANDGDDSWDYTYAKNLNYKLSSSFDMVITYGDGLHSLCDTNLNRIAKVLQHPTITTLQNQKLEFALTYLYAHDAISSEGCSETVKKLAEIEIAQNNLVYFSSCYSGKYHKYWPVEKPGKFLITSSTKDETSYQEANLDYSQYFRKTSQGGYDLASLLKFFLDLNPNSTPLISGKISDSIIVKSMPINELLECSEKMQALSDNDFAESDIVEGNGSVTKNFIGFVDYYDLYFNETLSTISLTTIDPDITTAGEISLA